MDNTKLQPENNVAPTSGEVGQVFRVTMRGFNKQDVTDYIERISRDRRRDAERYGAHIRSMEEQQETANQEITHLRAQAAALTGEAFEARREKEEAERLLITLREELEAVRGELAARPETVPTEELERRDAEIARLNALLSEKDTENNRLRRELEAARHRPAAGAELVNRMRQKSSDPARRARQSLRDSAAECEALSSELRRKLARHEELLRELGD